MYSTTKKETFARFFAGLQIRTKMALLANVDWPNTVWPKILHIKNKQLFSYIIEIDILIKDMFS